jgi:aminoglycoside phosphotransferase (APT) family kinase protein
VTVDPRSADEIAATTQAWIREHVPGGEHAAWISSLVPATGGMATFIWFGWLGGAGLPDEYRGPLALRVFATDDEDPVLERESAILGFVAAAGYPVPCPLATARAANADNPVGLPWMVMPKVPGRQLLEVLAAAPWSARARLRELAALQVALHRIPLAGSPLPADGALVDRWLEDKREQIEGPGDGRANALLARMRTRADVVRDEVPVVCHGDFHPLNVLSRPLGSGFEHVVIDWTDSVAGDRHYDIARTVAIFRLASIVAGSGAERLVLKAAGPWLARTYRRAYECELPIDPKRFAYWTAAHLLRGWAQIVGLHEGLYADGPGDADAVPLAVAEALLVWAAAELDSIG